MSAPSTLTAPSRGTTGPTGPAGPPAPGSPAARRARRPGWRDPRLAVGVLLVALSVVVGVRVVDGRDDTTPVLAATRPLPAGQPLAVEDLRVVQVRFGSADDAARYLPGDADLTGVVLARGVGQGELLPRSSLTTGSAPADARLPLAVPLGRVPSDLTAGAVVDVWATGPADGAAAQVGPDGAGADGATDRAERLLSAVPVLSVGRSQGLGPEGDVRVVVGVPDRSRALAPVLDDLASSSLLLVDRPETR